MGYVAWALDIAGFVVFVFTNTVGMYALAAGLCGVGVLLAHNGMNDDKAVLADRERCASARSSAIVSIVVIGVWTVLAALRNAS